ALPRRRGGGQGIRPAAQRRAGHARRRPGDGQGATGRQPPRARAALGGASATWALAQGAGEQAVAPGRAGVRAAWGRRRLVEGRNSVLRMQQARRKRLRQGPLDLKRLYGNTQVFVAGKRKRPAPYARLGLALPKAPGWGLLQTPPEPSRQQLSALNPAA